MGFAMLSPSYGALLGADGCALGEALDLGHRRGGRPVFEEPGEQRLAWTSPASARNVLAMLAQRRGGRYNRDR